MLSLVIPTKNRPEFLMRALTYYGSQGFDGPILVGDSSDAQHLDRSKKAIESVGKKLSLERRAYPDLDLPQCLQRLIRNVTTPYVAWVADDDFIVPSSAAKCMKFLEENAGYSVAHGKAIRIMTKGSAPHGQIVVCTEKAQAAEESESAASRYLSFMRRPREVYFSVHRQELATAMFENVDTIEDRRFAIELVPNCLAVLRGKVKELDFLYLVRQINDYRYIAPLQVDTHAWIASAGWGQGLAKFRDILSGELARQDGMSIEEARDVIKAGMSIYIARRLQGEAENQASKYLAAGRAVDSPGLPGTRDEGTADDGSERPVAGGRRALAKLRTLMSPTKGAAGFGLQTLLRKSSKYHDDFIPVYNAVTGEPADYG